jgi:glycosyltransferase involved in cell wall biosynthesis
MDRESIRSFTSAVGSGPSRADCFEVAVLVPCHNEEATIGDVVEDIRQILPHAIVYVYDNNSIDRTVERAKAAGAIVRRENHQGKGRVVRRMFADIEADAYVLIDGDGTYDVESAPAMIARLMDECLDMIVGVRVHNDTAAYRPGHVLGNRVLTGFVASVFGPTFTDLLSGYRVFSRRFVKSFPALSSGFEIETELAVHALELGLPVAEMATVYYSRPEGSVSKLRTFSDGWKILWTIVRLYQSERPLQFFLIMGAALASAAIVLAIPLYITYLNEGVVPRIPTAILVTGMMLLASLLTTCGLVLDTVTRGRQEIKRLSYLGQSRWARQPDSARARTA